MIRQDHTDAADVSSMVPLAEGDFVHWHDWAGDHNTRHPGDQEEQVQGHSTENLGDKLAHSTTLRNCLKSHTQCQRRDRELFLGQTSGAFLVPCAH